MLSIIGICLSGLSQFIDAVGHFEKMKTFFSWLSKFRKTNQKPSSRDDDLRQKLKDLEPIVNAPIPWTDQEAIAEAINTRIAEHHANHAQCLWMLVYIIPMKRTEFSLKARKDLYINYASYISDNVMKTVQCNGYNVRNEDGCVVCYADGSRCLSISVQNMAMPCGTIEYRTNRFYSRYEQHGTIRVLGSSLREVLKLSITSMADLANKLDIVDDFYTTAILVVGNKRVVVAQHDHDLCEKELDSDIRRGVLFERGKVDECINDLYDEFALALNLRS